MSFGVAFRHQLLKVCTTPEALERHLAAILDPDTRQIQRDMMHVGADAPWFHDAIRSLDRLLSDMDRALATTLWLAGERLSLADIAYALYATHLKHLALEGLWAERPYSPRGTAASRIRTVTARDRPLVQPEIPAVHERGRPRRLGENREGTVGRPRRDKASTDRSGRLIVAGPHVGLAPT